MFHVSDHAQCWLHGSEQVCNNLLAEQCPYRTQTIAKQIIQHRNGGSPMQHVISPNAAVWAMITDNKDVPYKTKARRGRQAQEPVNSSEETTLTKTSWHKRT